VWFSNVFGKGVIFGIFVMQLGIPNCFAFFQYAYRFTQYDLKLKGTLRW